MDRLSDPSCSRDGCARERSVTDGFAKLGLNGKVFAEYMWIGGTGSDLHSKTKVLSYRPKAVTDLPLWHFDGSATGQASELCGVVYLRPRGMYPDPFRGDDHVLVLCDTYRPPLTGQLGGIEALQPHAANNRDPCERVMKQVAAEEVTFAVEQQYMLLNPSTLWPLGWPERANACTELKSSHYCGAGPGHSLGREFAEAHVRACLHAGLSITGLGSDATPGQWSYKLGPCQGIDLGDQLWVSRYILLRTTERFNVVASTDPKPVPGDWCGNGAPVKFSTRGTRAPGTGWAAIQEHVKRLHAAHMQHLMLYGAGNERRLTGLHQTSSVMHFSFGIEACNTSVRIPHAALLHQRGYYEDRRPASNMDPYLVTMMLVCTTLGVPLPLGSANNAGAASAVGGGSRAGPKRNPWQCSSQSATSTSEHTRGSSAILAELEELESFAPDTPPQNQPMLGAECGGEGNSLQEGTAESMLSTM